MQQTDHKVTKHTLKFRSKQDSFETWWMIICVCLCCCKSSTAMQMQIVPVQVFSYITFVWLKEDTLCSPFVHMESLVIIFPQITLVLTFVLTRLCALAFVPRLLSSVSLSSSSCSPLLTIYLQMDSSVHVKKGLADTVQRLVLLFKFIEWNIFCRNCSFWVIDLKLFVYDCKNNWQKHF